MVVGRPQQRLGIGALQGGKSRPVGIDDDIFPGQRSAEGGQVGEPLAVHDEAVEGVAHRHAAGLGVEHDVAPLFEVAGAVEIGVAHTGPGLDDRHLGVLPHKVDKPLAAPGE